MTALRKIRESIGITQAEAARKLGLSRQAYSNYELGKRQADYETLLKMAELFQTSVEALLGGTEKHNIVSNISAVFDDNIRMIPVFESVSAGFGAYADDQIVDYEPIRILSDYEADETICIRVEGDSMYPKIEDGDLIQVHKQDSVDSGSIAVMLIDGDEGVVKKVFYGSDWIELHSINPNYPPMRFEKEEVLRLRVVGLVKAVIHQF